MLGILINLEHSNQIRYFVQRILNGMLNYEYYYYIYDCYYYFDYDSYSIVLDMIVHVSWFIQVLSPMSENQLQNVFILGETIYDDKQIPLFLGFFLKSTKKYLQVTWWSGPVPSFLYVLETPTMKSFSCILQLIPEYFHQHLQVFTAPVAFSIMSNYFQNLQQGEWDPLLMAATGVQVP